MNADRLARWYRLIEYAVYGRALERSRFVFLDRLIHARRILMLGEGDGRALVRLLAVAPGAKVDVVDSSAEMIGLARARCAAASAGRVRFEQRDALELSLSAGEYDAVATFYFLDCFSVTEARILIERIANALAPGGLWLVTDFAIPARGWRRWPAKFLIACMYRFFGLTTGLRVRTLPPVEHLLLGAGLSRLDAKHERGGFLSSELWIKPVPAIEV